MTKVPEQIWIQTDHIPSHVALDRIDEQPDADEAHQFTGYTRTDVAQAQVAAAYEAAKKAAFHACKSAGAGYVDENERLLQRAENEFRLEVVTAIRALTPTDARAALNRIVQEAVKEALENARGAVLAERLFDEISTSDHRAHNAALDSAVQAIAALKGGEA